MPPALPTPGFPPLARFRVRLAAQDPLRLPPYAGSAWRGLLGHGLRRTACVTRQPTCAGCLLRGTCVYATLFETPADGDLAHEGYSALPHPFVLALDPRAPHHLAPGAPFDLGLHLLGPAIAQVPYLIHALGLAGQQGFGRARARFALVAVDRERTLGAEDWRPVYQAEEGLYHPQETPPPALPPAPERIRLRLVTPLRVKRDGRFLGARELTLADLLRALHQRLRRLADLYGGDPHAFDLPPPAARPPLTLTVHGLRWHDWTRYSSRQDRLMQLGGLIGELDLTGPGLAPLWPALWLGQWTHVGKGTAFGLGGYRLAAIPEGETEDRDGRKLANGDGGGNRVENRDPCPTMDHPP